MMGKKKKFDCYVPLFLSASQLEALDKLASEVDRPRSVIIRKIICQALGLEQTAQEVPEDGE
jgi:predicted transcriptional regulator